MNIENNAISIRFLIGLGPRPDGSPLTVLAVERERREKAEEFLRANYDAVTFTRAGGVWKEGAESTLVAEVIRPDHTRPDLSIGNARRVARELAGLLDQESVAVVAQSVAFSLESAPEPSSEPSEEERDVDALVSEARRQSGLYDPEVAGARFAPSALRPQIEADPALFAALVRALSR